MDEVAAARAGVIRVVHEQGEDHRVPCSLCGMPCEPDRLTEVFEDQFLCPECYDIYAASVRRDRARKRREDQTRSLTAMEVVLSEKRR